MASDLSNVLTIDTAMHGCGAGLYDAARGQCFSEHSAMARGQAESLVPMVNDVLESAGLSYAGLEALVVTMGPGTFTGLRIGMSAAKSFALALDIPLYGITTLQAMALQYAGQKGPEGPVAVVIETKRQDFYVQVFDAAGRAVTEAQALGAEAAGILLTEGCAVIGDAGVRLRAALPDDPGCLWDEQAVSIDCGFLAKDFAVGADRDMFFTRDVEPVYLRGADVSMPKTKPRVLEGQA